MNQYAFTHLTFQEYYVAREIVSMGNYFGQLRRFLRNDRWQEVISLTAGLLDDLGKKALTEFLDFFITGPVMPKNAKPLQIAKLNLLIACLKDKVEPEAHVSDYVRKSLLSVARLPQAARYKVLGGLVQLNGFAKTEVGGIIVGELKKRVKDGSADVAADSMIVGYRLFNEDMERLDFLMFGLKYADSSLPLLGSAAEIVSA